MLGTVLSCLLASQRPFPAGDERMTHMLLSIVQPGTSLQIAAVVVPVSLYFLVLGLLNTRNRPQLLRARRDFAMLVVALSPLLVCPLISWVGYSWAAMAGGMAAAIVAMLTLRPTRASWVVYNIAPAEALDAVERSLQRSGLSFQHDQGDHVFHLPAGSIELSSFPLLRNVSIRMTGCDSLTVETFEQALAGRIGLLNAQTTPMAMAMLLVATAMLVAPLVMVAPKAVEIVRILTGMLY